MLVALFAIALVVALFALLPRIARNVITAPPEPPADIVLFPPTERPPEAIPPELVPPEFVPADPAPPEQVPVPPAPPEDPAAQPPQDPAQPPAAPPAERPAYATRQQGIFLVQVEDGGENLRLARVNRTLRASNTPLMDSLNALLSGPTAEESAQGMVSFISPGTRVLSVRVEGHAVGDARRDTAYISFNESFQFNPYGSEGLRYQIWQVVYTATEFLNVHDVQILIEGNRVDFLHEGGIGIGSPIGR